MLNIETKKLIDNFNKFKGDPELAKKRIEKVILENKILAHNYLENCQIEQMMECINRMNMFNDFLHWLEDNHLKK